MGEAEEEVTPVTSDTAHPPAMAEPFKTFLNPPLIRGLAGHLHRVWPDFDVRTFTTRATRGLDALELKARAMHVADALETTLPSDFAHAADVIEQALASREADPDAPTAPVPDDGLAGWSLWPVSEYVVRRGLPHPERALRTLHAITRRFTAEFAIRPFLIAHPEHTLQTLASWVHDPSAHVRRLVSEGTRPRLPWGLQLKAFIADPSPTLPLLHALQDDPSEYVRRSVANHLNDIAKDHPALVAEWVETHLPTASPARRALLKHASRTLIKQGDARVLHAWGIGASFAGSASWRITPRRVRVGEAVTLTLELAAEATAGAQALVVDYVVHHVRADGRTSPKVFKGWSLTLAPGEQRTLVKRHTFRVVTTRRYYPGRHVIAVQANGVTLAEEAVTLATSNA